VGVVIGPRGRAKERLFDRNAQLRAPEETSPAREGERVETQRDEAERHHGQEEVTVWLRDEECECPLESVRACGIAVQPGLDDEPADQHEHDAAREHPETSEPEKRSPHLRRRVFLHHTSLREGFPRIDELGNACADRQDPEEYGQQSAVGYVRSDLTAACVLSIAVALPLAKRCRANMARVAYANPLHA